MRILYKDLKKLHFRIKIDSTEDLWYLTYILEKGDSVKSKTFRKIKIGKENESIVKKPVFLSLNIERVELHKFANVLRVSGIISQGPDDVPRGSYHTINLETGSEFELTKPSIYSYQIEKLEEASKEAKTKILICVHDREEASFADLKHSGYELLAKISGNVQKKAESSTNIKDFYDEIKNLIMEYDKRNNYDHIIIASPSFWKEYLMKKIVEPPLKSKIILATCSDTGSAGIIEVINRPEVSQALAKERAAREIKLVEDLLSKISKKGAFTYGLEETGSAAEAGAVQSLLLTDGLIQAKRQDNTFEQLDRIMKKVDRLNGEIHIITSEHTGGKKLDGLGGIGALLRYKLNYE
jgi:protein pelota